MLPLSPIFFNGFSHPLFQAEYVGIKSIFAVTVTAFSPWNYSYLIPTIVVWVLKQRKMGLVQGARIHWYKRFSDLSFLCVPACLVMDTALEFRLASACNIACWSNFVPTPEPPKWELAITHTFYVWSPYVLRTWYRSGAGWLQNSSVAQFEHEMSLLQPHRSFNLCSYFLDYYERSA